MLNLHCLSTVLLLTVLPFLTSAIPEAVPVAYPDRYHHNQKCLSDGEARDILQRYTDNFETLNEEVYNRTFSEDYTYESDSTSFFLNLPPGSVTVAGRAATIAALRSDQALGPAFTVSVNQYTHTCDTIVFRYRIFDGRAKPYAIGGIDWIFVDLGSRLITKAYSEFNSAAILYNYGALGTPNATACVNGACDNEAKLVRGCGRKK